MTVFRRKRKKSSKSRLEHSRINGDLRGVALQAFWIKETAGYRSLCSTYVGLIHYR